MSNNYDPFESAEYDPETGKYIKVFSLPVSSFSEDVVKITDILEKAGYDYTVSVHATVNASLTSKAQVEKSLVIKFWK